MKINKNTKWSDIAVVYANANKQERIRVEDLCAERIFGEGGCWAITIGDFIELTEGRKVESFVNQGEAIGILATFAVRRWVEQIMEILKKLVPPIKSNDVSSLTIEMSFAESMLVFCRDYFGIQSFDVASKVAISDYILARKDFYNKIVQQQAINNRINNSIKK